ncbi:MAG TPA: glucoamylase family protein, partial [Sphingobacteriaceae bacterium]
MTLKRCLILLSFLSITFSCKKNEATREQDNPQPGTPASYSLSSLKVNGTSGGFIYRGLNASPVIQLSFSAAINPGMVPENILLKDQTGASVPFSASWSNGDSTLLIRPNNPLKPITSYQLSVSTALQSKSRGKLQTPLSIKMVTAIDSADKFSRISDPELLDLVQRQTFRYFWDFAHPVSGLARERNSSGDIVTTGGSGFGIMSIVTGIERNFITRAEGLARMQKIVGFLNTRAQKFHGAFPHWLNGNTGVVVPFSPKDDGADLVETSFLMQGLLTARQYFNSADVAEASLRADINKLWQGVEWNWFRKNNEDVLYWHWSPNYGWEMNMPIRGWNEALITYVLAASSPGHAIPKSVYDNGWAKNSSFKNGNIFYGHQLPLGPAMGGPLFFSHYSFLGIDPR